ncbi:MAG: DNA recombination protein RmuC [Planctomycetes bacterium]|nr:DNA recombination protein RmuC [Planctomycetota bacterium]MBL7144364.1 DNA recombination protein RmuC [Phycisphaerae bacterium]
MDLILTVVIIVLVLAVLGLLVWLIISNSANAEKMAGQQASIGLLQQQLEALKSSQDDTKDKLQKSLLDGQTNIGKNMQAGQEVLDRLNKQIGELQGTNKQMMQVGTEVRRLQDILSSPKLRGQMGEWSLENLLANILPKDRYKLQYTFKDGKTVDALIELADFSVPVDAKFPLPGFEKIVKTEEEAEKIKLRRQFLKDVNNHIDKIASDYIRPAEGTLDFALMYIPAENVYYETIVKYIGENQDILQYCFDKKVIPVSPNLLYAYLMTVAMGLHGLQIEKQAAEIRQNLKKLNSSFADYTGTWDILGKHLRNAYSQYDEGQKKLDRFGLQLNHIQEEKEETNESVQ